MRERGVRERGVYVCVCGEGPAQEIGALVERKKIISAISSLFVFLCSRVELG